MSELNSKKKLAIIYCWPSTLNYNINNYDLDKVADDFAKYDMVVLGSGLENSSQHPDHNNTQIIINKPHVSNTEFYGYINTNENYNINKSKIDNWQNMGSQIKGIFCNLYGYDFGTTRRQQNKVVDYIHSKGLKAFVNAWNLSDIFDGNPIHHLTSDDWILLQSFQLIDGEYRSESVWRNRSDQAISYKNSENINVAVTTTTNNVPFDQNKLNYAYKSYILDDFDSFSWGEYSYGSSTSIVPYRTRPEIYGTKYISGIINNTPIYERQTNIGIHVDTNNHTADKLLD